MLSQLNPDQSTLAAIGMGSNLGTRETTLLAAWQDIGRQAGIHPLQLSSPYQSAPLGMDSTKNFINAVGLIKTTLPPLALLHTLQDVELRYGRRRDPRITGYQDRTLDLDLLFWGELCLESNELTLPHPHMHERLFVLAPLTELLPQWQHPLSGISANALFAQLSRAGTQCVQCGFWSHNQGLCQGVR